MRYQWRKYAETPGGGKASVRPRRAVARGGSAAAPGKRSVFPERRGSNFLFTSHFVYKSTNVFNGASNRSPNFNSLYIYQG